MPGLRDRNLRSGDLHEELGLMLLRRLALVAPVPRQEDVGIDAFATLVRPEGSRFLVPDVSFCVQLKSERERVVSYTSPDAMAWILKLELPLFIGRVSLRRSSIELFSTNRMHFGLLGDAHERVHLHLEPASEALGSTPDRKVSLHPPVDTWTLQEANRPDFSDRVYNVLRPHVDYLRLNIRLREIQSHVGLKWETGRPPEEDWSAQVTTRGDDVRTALEGMVPYIQRMLVEVLHEERYADLQDIANFMGLLRRWGIDPDPGGYRERMAARMADLARRRASEQADN